MSPGPVMPRGGDEEARRELYQQVILEHNRRPRNSGPLPSATHRAEGYNPLCGDHLKVYLRVDPDGRIAEATFEGDGCAISRASASMMTTALKGCTVAEAERLFDEFHRLLTGDLKPEDPGHHLGKLTIFSGIWQYPSRIKCAGLAWHAVHAALQSRDRVSTE